MELLGIGDSKELSLCHRSWVEEALKVSERKREDRWFESIAVGSPSFLEQIKIDLGPRGFGRSIISSTEGNALRESQLCYEGHLGGEKMSLSYENSLSWCIYDVNTL
jgi:hypothetical protein